MVHAVGDAFLVPQPAVAQSSDAALITLKTLDSVAEPSRVDADQTLHPDGKLGIALFPEDGADTKSLIGSVGAARYRAKRVGGGDFANTE
jgi:GGDEF domain-containing protein